jgi:protein-L-isoaspartate(D-aspartate) O-methyltransferase
MRGRSRTQQGLARAVIREGVRDPRVLQAFREVPRAAFVPADQLDRAYRDVPVPIPHQQVTTQPSLVAKMVEALELGGDEKVLEVGTGLGFQTALLSRLARSVWSVERWPDLAAAARSNLQRHGADNVEVVVGDGSEGMPSEAPFDAVLVSAAFPQVPEPLATQLALGGRLVQPIGAGGSEEVIQFVQGPDGLAARRSVSGARFVRLYGRHGFAADEFERRPGSEH